MNPLKQGLKLLKYVLTVLNGSVKEVNPLKQGLKLTKFYISKIEKSYFVKEVNPLKQGLKPPL